MNSILSDLDTILSSKNSDEIILTGTSAIHKLLTIVTKMDDIKISVIKSIFNENDEDRLNTLNNFDSVLNTISKKLENIYCNRINVGINGDKIEESLKIIYKIKTSVRELSDDTAVLMSNLRKSAG
jgi:hypothetical protein